MASRLLGACDLSFDRVYTDNIAAGQRTRRGNNSFRTDLRKFFRELPIAEIISQTPKYDTNIVSPVGPFNTGFSW